MRDNGTRAGVSGTVPSRPLESLPRGRKDIEANPREGVSGTEPKLSRSEVVMVNPSLLFFGGGMDGTMNDGEAGAEKA